MGLDGDSKFQPLMGYVQFWRIQEGYGYGAYIVLEGWESEKVQLQVCLPSFFIQQNTEYPIHGLEQDFPSVSNKKLLEQ